MRIHKCSCKGSPSVEKLFSYGLEYFVVCADCGKRTASFMTEAGAISQWNKIAKIK